MGFEVEVRNVDGAVTALGAAGPHTLVVDSAAAAGGGGRGFNGGQLLHLAVAGCVSNDLFREAAKRGIELTRVVITADGGYSGQPAVSTGISYSVEIEGLATEEELGALVRHVDEIAQATRMSRESYSSSQATLTASCSVISLSTDAVSMVLPSGTTPLEVAPSSRTAHSRKTPARHQRGGRSDALSTPAGLAMRTDPVASRSSLFWRSIPASASSTSPTLRSKAAGSSAQSPASSRTTPIIAPPRPPSVTLDYWPFLAATAAWKQKAVEP
jgi:putative redox protein